MKQTVILFLIALTTGTLPSTYAASYYSDPVGGSMANDGSEAYPWDNLEAIFLAKKAFSAGDEIILLNGAHGQPFITGHHTDYVTIKSFPGHTPKIASVLVENGSYWAFEALTFTSDGSGGSSVRDYLFITKDDAPHVKIENCTFYSAESSIGWSKADWYTYAEDGLRVAGDYMTFNSNTVLNTYFALQVEGDHAEVRNNLIDNFGADAIRALGSHAVYEGNMIRDAYIEDYNVNHDDGIQMYDKDNVAAGVVEDVLFRNNIIYSFADPITQTMLDDNLVGYSMQGIIVTDGHAENVVAENNLIVIDHYHGITLAGAIDCRIQNNTVIKTPQSVNPVSDAFPWIQLREDKQHNNPVNSIIRNNIASAFTPWSYDGGINVLAENNLEPAHDTYTAVFADYFSFDFILQTNSPAIDAGINTDLTAYDLAHQPRLAGPFVDIGAYETQAAEDTIPPEIVFVADTYYNDEIKVTFSESVTQASAEDAGHYALSDGSRITGAELSANGSTVTLKTSPLTGGFAYSVTATGIEDHAGNSSIETAGNFIYLCDTNWASTFQDDQWGTHPPENAFDGSLSTKWAAEGTAWIQKNFCRTLMIESVEIAFPFGNQRRYSFMIETSMDGRTFTPVFSGQSSGTTTDPEHFDFTNTPAKYVKITGSGNNVNNWNNYSEIMIHTAEPALSGYALWLLDYPGVGTATNLTDDPDHDDLNNLYEWGLGGHPADSNDPGYLPALLIDAPGDNRIEYIYAKRNDADALGLTYGLELNTDLTESGAWTNSGYTRTYGDPDAAGPGFRTVTNQITTTGNRQFLRLTIEKE